MDIDNFVTETFSAPSNCYGHCKEQTNPVFRKKDGSILCFQACPGRYVSRVIFYNADPEDLISYLKDAAKGIEIKERDVRVATRYGWDLGLKGTSGKVMRVSYWTQNYGASKVSNENRRALFLCSRCESPFVKEFNSIASTCERCSRMQ
jgi:hypothetical protein